jgi:hypothetical protein
MTKMLRYSQMHSYDGGSKRSIGSQSCHAFLKSTYEAPSERIFSTESLLLSKFRNCMDLDLAGRMVFAKRNSFV